MLFLGILKDGWTTDGPADQQTRKIYRDETLLGEIFVRRNYSSGEIFVTKQKIRHFRQTKGFAPPKKSVLK